MSKRKLYKCLLSTHNYPRKIRNSKIKQNIYIYILYMCVKEKIISPFNVQ